MRGLIFAFTILLVGCGQTPRTSIVDVGDVTQHPSFPKSVYCRQLGEDSVVTVGENPEIKPEAVATMGSCFEEMLRYINDAEVTLCYYREELNEPRCSIYRDAIKALHAAQETK